MSFISTPSAIAVQAWRRSIAEAETRTALSAYVLRSHFCLLAPRDEDIEHELFRKKEEETRLQTAIADLDHDLRDVERFIAFLGFCDLLSAPAGLATLGCRSRTPLIPPRKAREVFQSRSTKALSM
jgi:hypothetical protein